MNTPSHEPTAASPSWIVWLFIGTLGLLTLYPMHSYDDWWHLAYGRWIVEHGAIPTTDAFSWTHAGQPLHNVPWLSSLLFYAAWALGGIPALVLLKPLAAWACLGAAWLRARFEGARWTWFLAVLGLAFFLIHPRLTMVRALMTSFVVLPAMAALWAWSRHPERRRWQWGLLPLAWIWASGHGSYPVLIAWVALTTGWAALFSPERSRRSALHAAALTLGTGAATLLTPGGPSTWGLILHTIAPMKGGGEASTNYLLNNEALPPSLDSLLGPQAGALAIAALTLAVLPFLPWRRVGADLLFLAFTALLALGSNRFLGLVGLAALLALPTALTHLQHNADASPRARLGLRAAWVALACIGLAIPAWAWRYTTTDTPPLLASDLGFHIRERRYPAAIARFLNEHRPQGRLYNVFDAGGYLIWHCPDVPVFIDGRTNVLYPEAFFADTFARHALTDAPLTETLDRYHADLAILPHDHLATTLWNDPAWIAVAYDDHYALFLRQGAANDALIQRYAFTRFHMQRRVGDFIPAWQQLRRDDPQAFHTLHAETQRAHRDARYEAPLLLLAARITEAIEAEARSPP